MTELPPTKAPPGRTPLGWGEAWALVSSAAYAFTNILSRMAVSSAHPLVAPAFRLVPTMVIAWGRVLVTRLQQRQPLTRIGRASHWALFIGGALTSIGTVGFFYALREGGVVLTAPVQATGIFWGALIAWLFLKEPLSRRLLVGILITVAGVALLGYGRSVSGTVEGERPLLAILLALIPAVAWAASSSFTRFALLRGVEPFRSVAISQGWGLIVLVVFVVVSGNGRLMTEVGWDGIWPLLVAGALAAVAQIAIAKALALTSVASVQTIGAANPVLSAILAWALLDEMLTPLMITGIVLTVIGVVYAQISKSDEPRRTHE